VGEEFRETLYTIDKRGNRRWVYPALVKGWFFRHRRIVIYALMAFYLSMPWLTVAGEQAIFLDIPHRRFVFFGAVFWATDTFFLVLLLGALALSLFFFTALFGRVWCGWACPETVFLEFVYRPIERLIEGEAAQRRKLDASPWTFDKVRKKSLKLFVFLLVSWILASTFLAYFVGAHVLINMMQHSPALNPTPFTATLILMGAMMFQFGWFREQFCTVVCPYARFQSVLMDSRSLAVSYDYSRGEPRSKLRSKEDTKSGDCVDCGLCVRVCPTGIDIRNGLQLECIQCTACIDACDSVMAKINKPMGLIRYATEEELKGEKRTWVRPRPILYGLILVAYFIVFSYRMSTRSLLDSEVVRGARDIPYSTLSDNRISNHLTLRFSNKSKVPRLFSVSAPEYPEVEVLMPVTPFPVGPGALQNAPLFLNFGSDFLIAGKKPIRLIVQADDGFEEILSVTLLGPALP
jgi:cytochrome c oxidase accessory protein FixG